MVHTLLNAQTMTSHPVTYERFPNVSDSSVELDGEADVMSPFRGILMGIALCAPIWTALYLVFRAMWS